VKKLDDNRYPHSAELFRFCKEALSTKHNNEVKVIDSHVGALLDFDPADCSHWKRGKKNIKSSDSLRALSAALQVDMSLLNDLVSGRSTVESALIEYRGLGQFDISAGKLEEMRTAYLRTSQKFQNLEPSVSKSHDVSFSLEKETTIGLVKEIIERAEVFSCPVMIPEILSSLNESENGRIQISEVFPSDVESSPQTRFLQAKEIGKQLLFRNLGSQALGGSTSSESGANDLPEALVDARCNVFALNLLVPEALFQRALKQVDLSKDFVAALSDIFWVSRSVIQARLQDII
jgi:hypothetical protein